MRVATSPSLIAIGLMAGNHDGSTVPSVVLASWEAEFNQLWRRCKRAGGVWFGSPVASTPVGFEPCNHKWSSVQKWLDQTWFRTGPVRDITEIDAGLAILNIRNAWKFDGNV